MIDIIFQFPKSAVYFFRFSRKYVNKAVYRHTIAMVLAIILIRGSRNYANVLWNDTYFAVRKSAVFSISSVGAIKNTSSPSSII